jgi:hypothetical protein
LLRKAQAQTGNRWAIRMPDSRAVRGDDLVY